ncbi:hypothetical protein [Clostridium thermopalmarium]|uniref:Uncharacterized protein n=1 Tax=Clostridium thermopalmarium DSM 5974 TaxID=1121340 RepID=A0A2T0APE3_9CLOT|nr:hypothetical protein [Clostridium thermopalmarium]PRR70890.1 hypothetical protein CPAL_19800 [Clostridium thermopalmarium DSM 5974]PVZ28814.1 hypothetical protein LX19_00118 [Clostridium thermopalmarium DSM 5974]
MPDIDQALEYIFGDVAPDGTFREEAFNTYKELQHRKKKRKQQLEADISAVTNRSYDRVYKEQYSQYYSFGHKK